MSGKHITRRSLADIRQGRTDWSKVDARSDQEVEHDVAADPDAAPVLDAEWFANAQLVQPEPKVPISIRLDREVLDWFKGQGTGYQSRINAVLQAYVKAHRKAG
ncbi:conserved hypothetical protein [Magnetospirillum sp. LM-5]|uniref:BrnA antitoxin family protein n=1 Tax=Magnetospirillum sp. LM-5 TaxID=2681466 RepID=UPI0013835577|nr:BrnA antitoxin family protein [Magnetospirillum sp. LM-5]CAA7621355.1 conserved hypothetical protein [Magnetospirillum sp. LM-5]